MAELRKTTVIEKSYSVVHCARFDIAKVNRAYIGK